MKDKQALSASTSNEEQENSKRRSFLKGLASVPILGALPGFLLTNQASAYGKEEEAGAAASAGGKAYELKGVYMEACNCDSICPCVLLADPTEGYCEALIGWHIEKGHLHSTGLDGMNFAVWLRGPENLTKGNWKMAHYIDARATKEQHQALDELWHGKHGGYLEVIASLVGEDLGTKSAPVHYKVMDKRTVLTVEGVGEAEIVNTEGAEGKSVLLNDTPLAVAPGFPITVATSDHLHYNDYGIEQSISGRNGFHSPFFYNA